MTSMASNGSSTDRNDRYRSSRHRHLKTIHKEYPGRYTRRCRRPVDHPYEGSASRGRSAWPPARTLPRRLWCGGVPGGRQEGAVLHHRMRDTCTTATGRGRPEPTRTGRWPGRRLPGRLRLGRGSRGCKRLPGTPPCCRCCGGPGRWPRSGIGTGKGAGTGSSGPRCSGPPFIRCSGGRRPLDESTRTDMESRLGADFSDVRVHSGPAARSSAAEVGARAYTSGSDIVIGEGGADRHTLAHELVHVIQQRRGPVAGTDDGAGLKVSDPADRFEREAEATARRVMAGRAAGVHDPGPGAAARTGPESPRPYSGSSRSLPACICGEWTPPTRHSPRPSSSGIWPSPCRTR